MKRTWLIALAAVLAVALGGIFFSGKGHAPLEQPPMVEMDNGALSGLRAEFNRTSDGFRVILLLSPT